MGLVLELVSAANIQIIEEEKLERIKPLAKKITPDKDDSPYFAIALYKNCRIWSNDSLLKNQNRVIVINTKELLAMLGGAK